MRIIGKIFHNLHKRIAVKKREQKPELAKLSTNSFSVLSESHPMVAFYLGRSEISNFASLSPNLLCCLFFCLGGTKHAREDGLKKSGISLRLPNLKTTGLCIL